MRNLLWSSTIILACHLIVHAVYAAETDLNYKERVKSLFDHAFVKGYMGNAFPLDELDPLECKGVGYDIKLGNKNQEHLINGGFMLTLVDSLSTIGVIHGEDALLTYANKFMKTFKGFDIDNNV